ncbi:MAG: FAD-dependent oxidoreductase [Myxococcales bacterium]
MYGGRREQMFPRLSAAQVARLAHIGERRQVSRGEMVVEQGESTPRFFVVISGALAIVHPDREQEVSLHVLREGEFTGEVNMLSARPSLVRTRAIEAGELLVIRPDDLHKVVQADVDLSEILMRAFILRRVALIANSLGDAVLLGSTHSAATLRIREFLTRNGQPHAYLDVDKDPDVQALLDRFGLHLTDVPVVICGQVRVLKSPSNAEIAECLGLNRVLDPAAVRDLVIVGAGPAGLAAAVYAASEGLDVLVLESSAPGGQAGSSSKIENYLGFPTGISGEALAGRAYTQAQKFGAEIAVARSAVKLRCERPLHTVEMSAGGSVTARSLVIATGVQYRKLPLAELPRFEGLGVYYGATHVEAQLCQADDVIIVGGANSAGQAAVFLGATARQVRILVRGPGLAETMSRYLIRRIEDSRNIAVRAFTEIVALEGDGHLERVQVRDGRTNEIETLPIRHVFVMTGAIPHTGWLQGAVALDGKGFVKTGPDLAHEDLTAWPLRRPPFLLETSVPGVFAVGDVRAGSVKRVASAVGEGSICVQLVHRLLAE